MGVYLYGSAFIGECIYMGVYLSWGCIYHGSVFIMGAHSLWGCIYYYDNAFILILYTFLVFNKLYIGGTCITICLSIAIYTALL